MWKDDKELVYSLRIGRTNKEYALKGEAEELLDLTIANGETYETDDDPRSYSPGYGAAS